jgi:hypothetical protein
LQTRKEHLRLVLALVELGNRFRAWFRFEPGNRFWSF